MKSYQVVRTHTSPYQHPDFIKMEKTRLERLANISYRSLNELESNEKIILLTNTHTRLRELPPALLKATELIIHPNSGYDHFAQDHSLWQDIPVIVGHEIRAQAVAEYSLGCLFEGMLELPQHLMWNRERTWNRQLLKNQVIHVFGYGHIGKIVADTLKTLGMDVRVIDPYIKDCPHPRSDHWREAQINGTRAIIVCMSLNPTTRKIFNHDFFSSLGKEVIFINGARGGLVDEVALKEYMLKHPESFAFLDVFENEPFSENWHSFPQVWKTSHIAGVHRHLDQGILEFEEKVLIDFLNMNENNFEKKYHQELLQNKWIQGELI